MRLPPRALVAAALVPVGTVAGHAAGYLLAGQDASFAGDHGHLRPATWLTAAVAVLALGWVAAARDGLARRPRLVALAAAQSGLFLALEAAEHLAAGHSPAHLLHEPSLRWGLVAQLAMAAVVVLATVAARSAGQRARALLSPPARPPAAPPSVVLRPRAALRPALLAVSPATERGPPAAHLVPA
ncbi:MAG: hypothetical protein ACRD0N_10490 [Acidimicrobiales bacterium]